MTARPPGDCGRADGVGADLPRGALKLAAEAIQPTIGTAGPSEAAVECARAALTAALEVIQRDAYRRAAKAILASGGDVWDTHWTLKRVARAGVLPDLPVKEAGDDA